MRRKKNPIVLVAFGANRPFGDRSPLRTLRQAAQRLADAGVKIESLSRWRGSPAFPPGAGPDFVNGAARVTTEATPEALLKTLHDVEAAFGRERRERWSARTCDLDLIAFGDDVAPDEATVRRWMDMGPEAAGATCGPDRLILPHPRAEERAFVLAPIAEIAPEWRHPLTGRTAAEALAALPAADRESLRVLDERT